MSEFYFFLILVLPISFPILCVSMTKDDDIINY